MAMHLQNQAFGRPRVGVVGWEELFADWQRLHYDPRFFRVHDTVSIHAVSIPWQYSDDELAELFRQALKYMRPLECPGPQKSGRKGRSVRMGALDALRQLAALRCDRKGLSWSDPETKAFPQYQSQKGWRKAINSARHRIDVMLTEPFYGGRAT